MNHLANFNQTWHNSSLGEGGSILFKWMAPPFLQGEIIINCKNTYIDKLKKNILQNRWTYFNQTWQKSSLGAGDSKFKWRALPFSKGDNYEIAKIH